MVICVDLGLSLFRKSISAPVVVVDIFTIPFLVFKKKKNIYLNKSAIMTYMCQKRAATLGKTELTYNPLINTEDEEYDSKEEEEMNNLPRHS